MKLKTAISYRLLYQLKSGSIFFGLLLIFAVLFPNIAIIIAGTDTLINSDVFISSCIFVIILAFIGITSDFKLFIQNGMSRNHIFFASITSNFLLVSSVTVVIFIVKKIVNLITSSYFNITLPLIELYAGFDRAERFILLFLFLLAASSLGTLVGICRNSLSNITQLFLLGILTVLPTLLIVLLKLASPELLTKLFDFLKDIVGITDTGFHILPLMAFLIVCYLLFTIITYLLSKRREIQRIDG